MPERIPSELKFQSLSLKVIQLGDGRLAFDYYEGSKRIVVKRSSLADLRAKAKDVADRILNAETAALDVTAEDRRIYLAAAKHLAPLGIPVDVAARDLAEAIRISGIRNVIEMARVYVANRPEAGPAPASAQILTELLDSLRMDKRPRSDKYLSGLKRDLAKFCTAFPKLELVTKKEIHEYLRALTTRAGQPIGPRRRDNIRDGILRLFHYAKDEKFLTQDKDTAADAIERIKAEKDVTTYSPAELATLLQHISWKWRPWMAIAAFAGLRTSEIFRLDWSAVKWDVKDAEGKPAPVIAVKRSVARKVRTSRLVPISANLATWLKPWRDSVGEVYPHKSWRGLEKEHQLELARLAKASGIPHRINALRHSFGSHRLAVLKSYDAVAIEMGNSPAKVREDYNDPKDQHEGALYFSIMPPEHQHANILPLALEFAS